MSNKNPKKVKHKKSSVPWAGRDIRWDKLDNTAHLFPVIAGEDMTSVYRISVTLREEIDPELLQKALDMVLPKFYGFDLRLRRGFFWYYFEENGKSAPRVQEEAWFPCRFIRANRNHNYLFRVTYYKCRINLEVFHVLTDGMGGLNFIKELCYQYLRLKKPELQALMGDSLNADTSLNREDSFIKHYRRKARKGYQSRRAYLLKGERLPDGEMGVMHAYMKVPQLKSVCKKYGLTINEYLIAAFIWSVYTECLNRATNSRPIRVAVPVNLRPYFNSTTSKNFFVMVSVEFIPQSEDHSFEDICAAVRESMKGQLDKEHLERLMSYNVAMEKKLLARLTPLPLKGIAMRYVYSGSALANTSTLTNIGNIAVPDEYREHIKAFHAFLPTSKGQPIRNTVSSFGDTLTFTFSYVLRDCSVQRGFLRRLSADGLDLQLESNGVNYE